LKQNKNVKHKQMNIGGRCIQVWGIGEVSDKNND
jgi:hypothetical protein